MSKVNPTPIKHKEKLSNYPVKIKLNNADLKQVLGGLGYKHLIGRHIGN